MKRVGTWSAALAAGVLAIVLGGGSASAEVFLDLYGGATMFGDPDFTVTREGQARETERGSADTNFTVGGRGGYWFDGQGLRWLGVALDISYFEPEYSGESGTGSIATVKVRTLPITPLVMFRLPLMESPQHPNGQLQLYTGAGPGFFVREATVRFRSGPARCRRRASRSAPMSVRASPGSSPRTGRYSRSTGSRTTPLTPTDRLRARRSTSRPTTTRITCCSASATASDEAGAGSLAACQTEPLSDARFRAARCSDAGKASPVRAERVSRRRRAVTGPAPRTAGGASAARRVAPIRLNQPEKETKMGKLSFRMAPVLVRARGARPVGDRRHRGPGTGAGGGSGRRSEAEADDRVSRWLAAVQRAGAEHARGVARDRAPGRQGSWRSM